MNDVPPHQDGPDAPKPMTQESEENAEEAGTPEAEVEEVEAPEKETADVSAGEEPTVEVQEEVEPKRVEPHLKETPKPHSMRGIKIGKVVINICTGQSGEPLSRAMTILQNLTGQRPCTRLAKQTIRTFGIRRKEPISCMVTLRGERAEEFLRKGLAAVGNRINPRSFDRQGNFAFGISEHIDIPGQRYDPNLGITGMDVMATVERPGYRVARRRRGRSRVGRSHRVTRDEAIEFIKRSFGVEVGLPSE